MSVEEVINVDVRKSGEDWIRTSIGRSHGGVSIRVWMRSEVEDFIRSLGTGAQSDVNVYGRHWKPLGVKDEGKQILIYDMSTHPVGPFSYDGKFNFHIDQPGHPIVKETLIPGEYDRDLGDRRPPKTSESLNISFLRLVGASEAGGVGFSVGGVYERSGIDKLAERIGQATTRFYAEFLKPYRCIVTVSTQPIF